MIPKRIFQAWCGPKPIPDDIKERCEGFRKMNPTWEYKLHGNELLERYGNDPYVKWMIQTETAWAFVMDRIRMLLLRDEGGLWVDADAKAVKSWDRLGCWKLDHVDFVAGFRNPHRPGVALHRGVFFCDNTFIASAKNGRMVNYLCALYNSSAKVLNAGDHGREIMSKADETTVFYGYPYFYSMDVRPETIAEHDAINLFSHAPEKQRKFATA